MKCIFFIVLMSGTVCFSCKKRVTAIEGKMLSSAADESSLNVAQSVLNYGDSIFYVKNEPGNYIIRPVQKPGVPGFFRAIPLGLVYDSVTGRINVTQSETGLKYKMYYLSNTGQRIDSTKIIISGIDYTDGIYDISKGQDTAFPVYAANPSLPLPCNDDDDDDDGCEFDERDLDDDGVNDIPGANSQGFRVNRNNAVINLKATLDAGALGPNPQNGETGDFKFYYRLDDLSNKALQDITVTLYYYKTAADVPKWLKKELNARRAQNRDVNNYGGGLLLTTSHDAAATKEVSPRPKRPPLIIITGYTVQ